MPGLNRRFHAIAAGFPCFIKHGIGGRNDLCDADATVSKIFDRQTRKAGPLRLRSGQAFDSAEYASLLINKAG